MKKRENKRENKKGKNGEKRDCFNGVEMMRGFALYLFDLIFSS